MKAGPVGGVPGELARRLGFWDSFLLSLGIVIGSGVFLTPHSIARDLPSAGFILAVWVVGGVLSMMGALAIAELGAMYPEAGGLYVYLREAFGPLPAFLYGWALFLIIQTGSAATLAVAFNVYAGYFIRLDAGQAKLVSVSLIAGLTFFNCLGIRQGATLNNCATFLKVGSILFMATAIFTGGAGAGNFRRPWSLPEGSSLLFGLGSAMIGADMIKGIDILKGAADLIVYHHECYDGSGFPRGLKGDQIPLGGHILSVIEHCEEMRMNGYSPEQIRATLAEEGGKKFHPDVANAYMDVLGAEEAKAA